MQVIPVIDLMGGLVVHARMGDRDAYRPIETPLSRTADPVDVVCGLMRLSSFPILYVADLDAIRRHGENSDVLIRLREAFPQVVFWIDNGAADVEATKSARRFGEPVLGSESQRDLLLLTSQRDALLSLDFRADEFLGPPEIWTRSEAWPSRVIVMTLARVGADSGPDVHRIASVRARAGDRQLYAAGGLRDARDLEVLKVAGAAGVLVASALHDGRLSPDDLRLE